MSVAIRVRELAKTAYETALNESGDDGRAWSAVVQAVLAFQWSYLEEEMGYDAACDDCDEYDDVSNNRCDLYDDCETCPPTLPESREPNVEVVPQGCEITSELHEDIGEIE